MRGGGLVIVRGRVLGIGSLLPLWILGIELSFIRLVGKQAMLPTQPSCQLWTSSLRYFPDKRKK